MNQNVTTLEKKSIYLGAVMLSGKRDTCFGAALWGSGSLPKRGMSHRSARLANKQRRQHFPQPESGLQKMSWIQRSAWRRRASEERAWSFEPCRLKWHHLPPAVEGGDANVMTPALISSTRRQSAAKASRAAFTPPEQAERPCGPKRGFLQRARNRQRNGVTRNPVYLE